MKQLQRLDKFFERPCPDDAASGEEGIGKCVGSRE